MLVVEGERGRTEMTKRVKFTDTGTTIKGGFTPIYDVTFDGQPFGQVWEVWDRQPEWAAVMPYPGPNYGGARAKGPNRGRAVAALLVKVHGLGWTEALDAAGVR